MGEDRGLRPGHRPATPKERRILLLMVAFIAVFPLVGLGTLASGLRLRAATRSSATWPSTPGTVTHSEVLRIGGDHYAPDVRYDYEVDGQRRSGRGLTLDDASSRRRLHAEQSTRDHPIGRPVQVFYDPADPTRCCLVPGVPPGAKVLIELGAAFFGLGGLFLAAILFAARIVLRDGIPEKVA